jgi:hypothetical protein
VYIFTEKEARNKIYTGNLQSVPVISKCKKTAAENCPKTQNKKNKK